MMVLSGLIGYLIGAISFARIVSHLVAPSREVPDVTELTLEGSDKMFRLETISASSVSVQHGSKFGFLTYVLDTIKVVIPVLAIRLLFPEMHYFVITAAAAVISHIWPVYYRFKGGRGLSAIYGTMLVIDWIGMFVASIGGMCISLFVLRSVLWAYLSGPLLLIPWLWFRTHSVAFLAFAIIANIAFTIAMLPEIKQWQKIKREDKWDDYTEVVQLSGMGRGIIKMARKVGVLKPKS